MVEIQSHSVNHYKFEDCDIDQVQYEVCESKKILEETFDIKINSFIYPY
ncbi:MAG: polysaccharide deacetylase family protein [bacterium]